MTSIELLAPARNADIGIAAIDCGADAVYIAGPAFGARKDAANSIDDISRLCRYATGFGVRIFVTFNILLDDSELDEVHRQMIQCQEAGASAFIIRDPRLCLWDDIRIPLHASTQCAIRTVERARLYEKAGCSRIVLERELPLKTIREICNAVRCEVEAFVHGALCVCYSGQCILSQRLSARSADRGECIQACRNLYDLVDDKGRIWERNKALLSLKDLNLLDSLETLLDAGVCSLKIEGRLKNESYVRNVVRAYSLELDRIIADRPNDYRRSSWGKVEKGFTPSLYKTFNREYTRLLLDSRRDPWANFSAPKSMGERLAQIKDIRAISSDKMQITLSGNDLQLRNGDGFASVTSTGIVGFRADIAEGNRIVCKTVKGLAAGMTLWRNHSVAFEDMLSSCACGRYIGVTVDIAATGTSLRVHAKTEDGREAITEMSGLHEAMDQTRAESIFKSQLEKHSGQYSFHIGCINGNLPHMSASALNAIRRSLAQSLSDSPCIAVPLQNTTRHQDITADTGRRDGEVMRSKYCIRAELGKCLKTCSDKSALYLVNNGKRFPLLFDCQKCEMAVLEAE